MKEAHSQANPKAKPQITKHQTPNTTGTTPPPMTAPPGLLHHHSPSASTQPHPTLTPSPAQPSPPVMVSSSPLTIRKSRVGMMLRRLAASVAQSFCIW